MLFRDISIGTKFDWVNDENPGYNSFFLACEKTGHRTYVSSDGQEHRVGSINAKVYHVGENKTN